MRLSLYLMRLPMKERLLTYSFSLTPFPISSLTVNSVKLFYGLFSLLFFPFNPSKRRKPQLLMNETDFAIRKEASSFLSINISYCIEVR